jgi:hypothetical protein
MCPKSILLLLFALTLVPVTWAQTKISGTLQCGKADPSYTIPVGDQPGHVFSIRKAKCTWIKAPEIAGMQAKDAEITGFGEFLGAGGQSRGASVSSLSNGDKFFGTHQGTMTRKEGLIEEGTWSITGGTGKLKGIKGKGTYKGKLGADDIGTMELEGEYQLPPTH